MAGTGGAYVLSKGFLVLSTYNSSAAAGVLANRCVTFGAGGTIDLNTAATGHNLGVVMENIDQAKVATGKAVAQVAMLGIVPVKVTTAASIVNGSRLMPTTGGGVILAATAASFVCGIAVGITGTIADGDIIQMMLLPGGVKFVA